MLIALTILGTAWLACGGSKSVDELRTEGKKLFGDAKYAEARDVFNKALRFNPSDREVMYLMGVAYRRDQLYDSALSTLRRVDLLYPHDREINQALYDVAMAMNDWAVARSALQGLINVGAAPPKHWKIMADLWRKDEHPGNVYHFTKKAIEADSNDIDLWMELANTAAMVDSGGAALVYIDEAIKRFGSNDILLANRATYLTFAKQYDSAEVILRSLLAKDTASVQFRLNLAHVLSATKSREKKREALSLYKLVQPKIDTVFKVDSLIKALETDLK
jgi:tetratricopeptide (TPR) repeat protein